MQLSSVLSYIFFTITVTASCVEADSVHANDLDQKSIDREIRKRSLVIEKHLPKVINYAKNQQSPARKLVPVKGNQGPIKIKYTPYISKYTTSNKKRKYTPAPTRKHKKRNYKPKYRKQMKQGSKLKFGKPKYGLPPPVFDISGFAKPPRSFIGHYTEPKPSYGEPPVISNGDKLGKKTPWVDSVDVDFAFSNQQLSYVNPNSDEFFDNALYNSYSPKYITDNSKVIKRPWKIMKNTNENVLVGGQYAEPPPRYLSRPKLNQLHVQGINNFNPFSNSSYVNYKNSNIAFSPQNLNDAFSIIDT